MFAALFYNVKVRKGNFVPSVLGEMRGNRVGIICCRSTRVSGMEGLRHSSRHCCCRWISQVGEWVWSEKTIWVVGISGRRGRGHEQTLLRVGCAGSCVALSF